MLIAVSRSISTRWLLCQGSKDLVTVNVYSGAEFMVFKPKMADDTIYVLQTLDWIKKCQSTHSVNSIDFEIIYHLFGHLSWEALRWTRKYTLEFPIIDIPSFDPLCPGCAQGKMPNHCFPKSNYYAIYPF